MCVCVSVSLTIPSILPCLRLLDDDNYREQFINNGKQIVVILKHTKFDRHRSNHFFLCFSTSVVSSPPDKYSR